MSSNSSPSQKSKKVEQFRLKIRRKQLEQYFEERRKEIPLRNQDEDDSQIIKQLKNSRDKQTQYLTNCSREITGEPTQLWSSTIQKLKDVVMVFDGQYSEWVSLSLIKNLVIAVKETYFPLKLTPQICGLFADLVYVSWKKSTNFTEKLMEYQIVESLIRQGWDKRYQMSQRMKILQLCATLSRYKVKYRNQMFKLSLGVWVLELAHEIVVGNYNQIVSNFMVCLSAFIHYESKDSQLDASRVNFFLQVISFTFHYFTSQTVNPSITLKGLEVLNQILKYNKDIFFSNVFCNTIAFKKIINQISGPILQIRIKALFTLSQLTYSDNNEICTQLVQWGFLDKALYAYYDLETSQNTVFCRTLMVTLSNIACSLQRNCNAILTHPIFQTVIAQISHPQLKNKIQGFYCLNTIISNTKTVSFELLAQKYQLLHFLTLGLNELRSVDGAAAIEIINTLTNLVVKSQAIYHPSGNLLVNKLQNTYSITKTLQDIVNNSSHNLLVEATNILHSYIAKMLWSSEALV